MKELKQGDVFKFEGVIYQIKRELTLNSWGKEIKEVYLLRIGESLKDLKRSEKEGFKE